ncbi:MAG: DUF1566 domain-containing protein [Planctomycetes bacterium]|nr:DUF1566 domain-containing protein [Planctomycetota bacterium]
MLNKRMTHLWSVAAFMAVIGFGGFAFAGDLEPGATPAPTMHTLDEIYDAVTGAGSNAAVPKTGQTTSFETGDDGDLQRGVEWPNPRFTDNLDGTITDNLTHLIWDKHANGFGSRNWNNAMNDCNTLADSDHEGDLTDGSVAGDWHLANLLELESLRHMGFFNPAVPNTPGTGQWSQGDPFNNVQSESAFYWSSTTVANSTTYAWLVDFRDGVLSYSNKVDGLNFVWCVRGGQ